jgi:hypothetical protein
MQSPAAGRAPEGRAAGAEHAGGTGRVQRFRSLPFVLILLLFALAALGVNNQASYRHQIRLIDRKAELHTLVADLRSQAAWISGPLAVGRWAREQGMIPAPEGRLIREVAPEFPPLPQQPRLTGLEVRTVWQ